MKNREGAILKKDIEWLCKAIQQSNEQILYVGENSAVATDLVRLHVINPEGLPNEIHGVNVKQKISEIDCTSGFLINPNLLFEALMGFNYIVRIEPFEDNQSNKGIKISSSYDNKKVALIMCMADKEDND